MVRSLVAVDTSLCRYRIPAGPPGGVYSRERPKGVQLLNSAGDTISHQIIEYLREVTNNSAVCDRCMLRISGEWFRCVYCAKDLCDACEAVDTHDDTHFFMVFKSLVRLPFEIPRRLRAECGWFSRSICSTFGTRLRVECLAILN